MLSEQNMVYWSNIVRHVSVWPVNNNLIIDLDLVHKASKYAQSVRSWHLKTTCTLPSMNKKIKPCREFTDACDFPLTSS